MKSIGLVILSIGLIGLSIIIGLANLIMHVDSLQGEYYPKWTSYLNAGGMLIPVLVTILLGIILSYKKKE